MTHNNLSNEEKLDRIYEMTLENHDILDGMRRRGRIMNSFYILYWIIVIGALGGAYYYVRPLLDTVSKQRAQVETTLSQFEHLRESLPETKALGGLLKTLRGEDTATSTQP